MGLNNCGQLGNGTNTSSKIPVQVKGVEGVGSLTGVTAISGTNYHFCAVKDAGLFCWGQNGYAQLGNGTKISSNVPVAVTGMDSGVTSVSTGYSGSCAKKGEKLYCWGRGSSGAIGDGTNMERLTPVEVSNISSAVLYHGTGYDSNCATAGAEKKLYCWGYNSSGQLGDGTTINRSVPTPVLIPKLVNNYKKVSLGKNFACALTEAKEVECWGNNAYNKVSKDNLNSLIRASVKVGGIGVNVIGVVAGKDHACAITSSRNVMCWGRNAEGQLGDNSTTDRKDPVYVVDSEGDKISDISNISIGGNSNVAYSRKGKIYTWGMNQKGQLGTGETDDKITHAVRIM